MSIAGKLTTIAENEQRVFEAGKTAEWNEMWDGLQMGSSGDLGGREDYTYFCHYNKFIVNEKTWNFKPKYDIKPTKASQMFYKLNYNNAGKILYEGLTIDLAQWLEEIGVTLDLSNCTNVQSMFQYAWIFNRLPVLDLSKCTTNAATSNMLNNSYVETIDGIIASEETVLNNIWSSGTTKLSHCPFSGVIASNVSVTFQTKLDYESLMSIINCLKDISGTGTTKTLALGGTNQAKLTDTEKAIATQKGWTLA